MKKLVFWGFLVAMVVLSLLPPAYLAAPVFNIWDKLQHAFGFMALTALGWIAFPHLPHWRLALALLALGGAIELAQHATGWRHAEWSDWLADALGIGAAWVAASLPWRALRFST